MLNLKELLEKYKNLKPTDNIIKDELIRILSENVGISIERDDIRLSRDVIYLNLSSVAKTALITQKQRVLDALFDATKQKFEDMR